MDLAALDAAGIGWTWWTNEPHSPDGNGFAPYDEATNASTWSEDKPWVDMLSGYMSAP